ncbi:hypothetical protein KFE98_16855 [bacterium SCSIO 12741]|nr:hypothetical protein KFE98_16855 [bacterium SCSIO 12741]
MRATLSILVLVLFLVSCKKEVVDATPESSDTTQTPSAQNNQTPAVVCDSTTFQNLPAATGFYQMKYNHGPDNRGEVTKKYCTTSIRILQDSVYYDDLDTTMYSHLIQIDSLNYETDSLKSDEHRYTSLAFPVNASLDYQKRHAEVNGITDPTVSVSITPNSGYSRIVLDRQNFGIGGVFVEERSYLELRAAL